MTANRPSDIKRPSLSSESTYESLAEAERNEQRLTDRPLSLPLSALHVAPSIFQWRDLKLSEAVDTTHMQELVRVLAQNGDALDPILVTPVGAKFFILDGHHRFDAYHTVNWKRPVPVEYFEGSLKEAEAESLRRNSKNKLPITNRDKGEAAWKLVRRGGRTQKQISEVTTVSVRTIATMAKVLREHPHAQAMTWKEATRLQWGEVDENSDDWFEEKAQKLASQWIKHLPSDFYNKADLVGRALEILRPSMPRELIHYWTGQDVELLSETETEFDVQSL